MRALASVIGLVLLAQLQASGAAVADCVDYGQYLHLTGMLDLPPNMYPDVAVAGSYAYVAADYGSVLVIDVSDPRAPRIIGSVGTPRHSQCAAVSGSYLYVGSTGGFQVFDITNPGSPQVMGSVDTWARAVAVSGGYAYVLADAYLMVSDLEVIDVTDPWNPTIVGSVQFAFSNDVAVSGGYAYIATQSSGLLVADITRPENPRIVAKCMGPVPSPFESVALAGSHAYVADDSCGLQVIDISDPPQPRLVGSLDVGGAYRVAVSGTVVYLDWNGTGYGGSLLTVDVTNPERPVAVGSIDWWGTGLAISGTHAYVTCGSVMGSTGLFGIIDVSNPGSPEMAGSMDMGEEGAGHVTLSDGYAYVTGRDSLTVLDITDPRNPRKMGSVLSLGRPYDVAVSGTYAYVTGTYPYPRQDGFFLVADVSQPQTPHIVGSTDTPSWIFGMDVFGTHAYVVGSNYGWSGLCVIDIADPGHPSIVGTVGCSDHATRVAVRDGYAYVTDVSGLLVIDAADPQNPTIVGSLSCEGAKGVTVVGSHYVMVGGALLPGEESFNEIVDVADPRHPFVVGSLDWGGGSDVAISGTYAYGVAGSLGFRGLTVIDIADLSSPQYVGSLDTPEPAYDVAVSGGYAYVADGRYLYIAPTQCESATSCPGIRWDAGIGPMPDLCAFPNPASPRTTIRFNLAADGRASATIYDVAGRQVRALGEEILSAGVHEIAWDGRDGAGRDVAPGVYLARVSTPEGTKTARVLVVR